MVRGQLEYEERTIRLVVMVYLFFILVILRISAQAEILSLHFKDSVKHCLTNNFDIKMSESGMTEKEASYLKAHGEYDFNFSASFTSDHSETPSSSSLDGVSSAIISDTETYKGEIKKKLGLLGTDISLPVSYSKSTSNSQYSRIPIGHNTSLGWSLSQPLLRVWSWGYYYRNLNKAEFDWLSAKEKHGEQLDKALQKTIELHFSTLREQETLKVRTSSFQSAKGLYEAAVAKERAGKSSYMERLEAQSKLLKAEEAMLSAESTLQQKKQELILHLALAPNFEFQVVDEFNSFEAPPPKVALDVAIESALKNRPEVKGLQTANQMAELDLSSAQTDLLPNLSAESKYTYKGLASNYSDSEKQIREGNFESRSLGLKLEVPLLMYAARGEHRIKTQKKNQNDLKQENTLRNIRLEVNRTLRQYGTNWERLQALRKAVEAESERAKGQMKRYEQGRISIFDLNQALQDKENSQLELVKARVNYIRSRFDFSKAQGFLAQEVLAK